MKTLTLAEKASRIGKSVIAACDESPASIQSRLEKMGLENTPANRQMIRQLLVHAVAKSHSYGAAILHMETMENTDEDGVLLPNVLKTAGKFVISKLDTGMAATFMTGVDTIAKNLQKYPADAVKCRYAFEVTASDSELDLNATISTQVAVECTKAGQVPILEPELLMKGDHILEKAQHTISKFLELLFKKLVAAGVNLAEVIVKYAIVLPGEDGPEATLEEIVAANRYVLTQIMPANLGGFVFLSGGIEEVKTMTYVNAIAANGKKRNYKTPFTSFGRVSHGGFMKMMATDQNLVKAPEVIEAALADFEHRGTTAWYAARALYTKEIEEDINVQPIFWQEA